MKEERSEIPMIFPSLIIKIERWRFNKDYGVYVSTLGNFKDRYKRRLPIKISNKKGYCAVKTEQGLKYAHRLVMLTWRPIPDAENLTVDHLNHNKRDNSVQNLEWVTAKENIRRAERDCYKEEEEKTSFLVENQEQMDEAIKTIMSNLPKCIVGQIQKGTYKEDYIEKILVNKLTRFIKNSNKTCKAYGITFYKNC